MPIISKNTSGKKISDNNDTINGTIFNDYIDGLGGDDTIDARAGADVVKGGAGRDNITGGPGDDTLSGDTVSGPNYSDSFYFGYGHGADRITDFTWTEGGTANDQLVFDASIDGYWVFAGGNGGSDEGWVRIVTLDVTADGKTKKAGSITLVGWDEQDWTALSGAVVNDYYDDAGNTIAGTNTPQQSFMGGLISSADGWAI